jgi:hypothetical protein
MELQQLNKAVFGLLKMVDCPVFDSVPENKKMPYIVLAETRLLPWNTKTTKGFEATLGILIYSDYKGDKEINLIAGTIADILSNSVFDLGAGLTVVNRRLEELKIERLESCREGAIKLNLKIYMR